MTDRRRAGSTARIDTTPSPRHPFTPSPLHLPARGAFPNPRHAARPMHTMGHPAARSRRRTAGGDTDEARTRAGGGGGRAGGARRRATHRPPRPPRPGRRPRGPTSSSSRTSRPTATRPAPAVITHNFGDVPHGTLCVHKFTITNIYDMPMQITEVRKSCTCLDYVPMTKVLQPNETGRVHGDDEHRQVRRARTPRPSTSPSGRSSSPPP